MMKRQMIMCYRELNTLAASLVLAGIFGPAALLAAEATNNSITRPAFSNFKMVAEKNIFNTKRWARYVPSTNVANLRPRSFDYVALVGIMSYDKGPFAFFEGSRSEYQKVLKREDSIAGFKVGEIESSSVKLVSATNQIELKVGMQLARQEE